jgi:hypothetical protein
MKILSEILEWFRRPYRSLTPRRPAGDGLSFYRLLYSVILDFQLSERVARNDFSFDGFRYLAGKLGHRNESTIRKMCEPRESSNGAKLGFEDAIRIIRETKDYRLFEFFRKEIRNDKLPQKKLSQ